ncbi:MAG: hypothetical protein AB1489_23250 [Acidobacteriota bacterium]
MTKHRLVALFFAIGLICLVTMGTFAHNDDEVSEEFHQSYPLAANGLVSLQNINGSVQILAWDRNEVKIDAVKKGRTRERLAEAEIRIDATANSIYIKTRYPERHQEDCYRNPASVEFTLTVPRTARLERIQLINGSLDISGITGEIDASSINGAVTAMALVNRAKLATINGPLRVSLAQLPEGERSHFNSVNGSIELLIPVNINAELRANTVHGDIENDFGLTVHRGKYVGSRLSGVLGNGSAMVKLNNVNGTISIRQSN